MSEGQPGFTPEFRRKIVRLVRQGRSPAELARKMEPSASTIRRWVKEADIADGAPKVRVRKTGEAARRRARGEPAARPKKNVGVSKGSDLDADERRELSILRKEMRAIHGDREELSRLRRENHALREERDILRQDREVLTRAVDGLFRKHVAADDDELRGAPDLVG